MLHIAALRGFMPCDLVIDQNGNIPMVGDLYKSFKFFWDEYYLPEEEKEERFKEWCLTNTANLSKEMILLSRWKGAINFFQRECDKEMAKRAIRFSLADLHDKESKKVDKMAMDFYEENG
jgi:hypothetical protein